MASLTIRKLDEGSKAYLRLRSAKNGRSVEEEVRVILREYLEGSPVPAGASLAPAEAAYWRQIGAKVTQDMIAAGHISAPIVATIRKSNAGK